MHRALALLTFALLACLPAVAHDVPADEVLRVETPSNGTYYVSLCRFNPLEDVTVAVDDAHVHLPRAGDCFESGVYKEKNGEEGLQTRAGVGPQGTYHADEAVLP